LTKEERNPLRDMTKCFSMEEHEQNIEKLNISRVKFGSTKLISHWVLLVTGKGIEVTTSKVRD
jgi:hypothetical protein